MTRALITGASSGIGLATAKLLLNNGYDVIGISRRGDVEELGQERFQPLRMDLSDSAEVDRGIAELLKRTSIDCFVHAAGYGDFGSIEQFSVARIERAIQVNLTSALLMCRQLVPAFRKRGRGQLIFIGSESALRAGRKGAVYSAAKFGLRGFSQALREDCAADGLRVTLINPGMTRSPFFDALDFAPARQQENAILPSQVAELVWHVLNSADNIVYDEINVSPRVKSIDFNATKPK